MKKGGPFRIETELTRLGRSPADHHGFVNTPIYRGSTVVFGCMDDLINKRGRYSYGRKGTPITDSLSSAWSAISKAAGSVATPSGVNAIALALLSCTKAGDHVLVADSVYYPTRNLCDTLLKNLGITTTFYDPMIGGKIDQLITPQTKAIFTESPGSLTFEVQDIPAIVAAARKKDVCVILDNTWATPLLFSPHEMGVDLCVEAGTKYLSGHSDLLLGLVSANEKYWPRLHETFEVLGACAGPEDQFLALRGLRTMNIRLKEQGAAALHVARWLAEQPQISCVLHPALPSCPGHDIWKRDFKGSSSVFSVVLKSADQKNIAAMLDGFELFGMGYSWGGYESLMIPFNCCTYRSEKFWKPEGSCLRIQIGLEHVDDLIADLKAGLTRLDAAT